MSYAIVVRPVAAGTQVHRHRHPRPRIRHHFRRPLPRRPHCPNRRIWLPVVYYHRSRPVLLAHPSSPPTGTRLDSQSERSFDDDWTTHTIPQRIFVDEELWTVLAGRGSDAKATEDYQQKRVQGSHLGRVAGAVHWKTREIAPESQSSPPTMDRRSQPAYPRLKPWVATRKGRRQQHGKHVEHAEQHA